ncbi:MAG: substrate-binding domain-containing protein [Candidatus Methanosuratincola sp.]
MKSYKLVLLASAAVLAIFFTLTFFGASSEKKLLIATTTSTVDSGLMDYIKPYFESKYGINLSWLSLGTGQALAVASRGDADLLLVHDREREEAFVLSGNGSLRVTVFYNDFVIVGPEKDPANVSSLNATACMERIAIAGESGSALFVSRGDGSGTHALEKRIWKALDMQGYENSEWYKAAGSGMSATLRLANELEAYTLADRATFIRLKDSMGEALKLKVVCEGDPMLLNPYSIVLLNSSRFPNIRYEQAVDFLLFITSTEGQRLVGDYTISGEHIFFPIYNMTESIGLPSEDAEVNFVEDLRASRK